MKHLKLFENIYSNLEYWLVSHHITTNYEIDFTLYPDEESAKNYIIMIVNKERQESTIDNYYSNDMIFTDVDSALDWYHEIYDDIHISYEKITLSNHYELPEKILLLKNISKYNL